MRPLSTSPLRPRQIGHHFADDTLNRIFLNENVRITIKISLKFAPKGPINNIPALVQIMAWRRPGNKPLSEPMVVSLLMHICVTRPQWVNKSMLGHVTPLGRPRSIYKSDIECFSEFWVKLAKWPWRSRSMTPIFNTSRENPKMNIWGKFDDFNCSPLQVITRTSQIS